MIQVAIPNAKTQEDTELGDGVSLTSRCTWWTFDNTRNAVLQTIYTIPNSLGPASRTKPFKEKTHSLQQRR